MTKLSVVLSVYNEAQNLKRTLSSVSFADEIIVIDNQSTDSTATIAKNMGAIVYQRPNNLMLNVNKNYGFSKAKNNWILNLDGDEVVDDKLRQEISEKINDSKLISGYWLPRKNIIFGKWIEHSLWWPDYHLRLFKNGSATFPCEHIHEHMKIKGNTGYLTNPLIHYNYNSVSQFLTKLDKIYTENEADLFLNSGRKLYWTDVLTMPFQDFLKTFFSQKGYKDGLHGLVLSLLQSFYQIVIFAKVWERQKFKIDEPPNILISFLQEIHQFKNDFIYWKNSTSIQENKSFLGKIYYRIKRKLEL